MAKLSMIVKNERRKKMADKYKARRAELRTKAKDAHLPEDERIQAQIGLQKLPRNSAKIRVRNRCALTGRPRGYYRTFRLCRIKFRELALSGMLPGVTKSSW